jgi:transposase
MISKDIEGEIIRLYRVEQWPIGTIASQLHVHHRTIRRVLDQDGRPRRTRSSKRKIDAFVPFIQDTLANYPSIAASRVYEMLKERGYQGKDGMVRHVVTEERGRRQPEAFLRLSTLPGEQAQVDWGHFGQIKCGKATRMLSAFVIVLAHSRALYLRFYVSQNSANFMHGHELAFQWFGGIPRVCLYDNLKAVVIERSGRAIRFNDQFLEFANHCRFEARPVNVARGNEKGRVERAIRYVRTNFFTAREFKTLADLNEQALHWCETTALERAWQQDSTRTIKQALLEERSQLLPLRETSYPCQERQEVVVGKSPYVRFDLNDYSVPHTAIKKTLVVMATVDTVRVIDGQEVIATHYRSYDKGQQIENPAHIEELIKAKAQASEHRNLNQLRYAVPASIPLLESMADRGLPLKQATNQLRKLLEIHGASALNDACQEALTKNVPHHQAVRNILERLRQEQGNPPAFAIPLPEDPRLHRIVVKSHDLKEYDALLVQNKQEENNE